ncbi:MAG: tRNA dihydrouridine synthase DusB [Bacillota bacterium]|nr:tRNA dihydrouridine synthase DusB [Bacillota bacterium]
MSVKIGNVKIDGYCALAPMAGVADRAFRELCASFGAAYVVSEMVSAKGIAYNSERSKELMVIGENERPAGIQLFGDDPAVVVAGAEFALTRNPDILDINMGCPAPKIAGGGSGAALMKNPKLCGEIVKAVKKISTVPVTVKIRKGWDAQSVNAVEVAKICEENGADAITVHGRTREQMYAPSADLEIIAKVKEAVNIPVIGNGDVDSPQAAAKMFDETNCDLIMVGRAAMGNPWLFMAINSYLSNGITIPPPSEAEKLSVMLRHIETLCCYKGERIAMKEARKHVGWYLKGFHGAAEFRREACALNTFDDLKSLIINIQNKIIIK